MVRCALISPDEEIAMFEAQLHPTRTPIIPDHRAILPSRQRVAEGLKTGNAASWIEHTSYAIDRSYISFNNPEGGLIRFLAVDVDHDDHSIPGGMPLPMVTVFTRESGRHHHVWELASPVATTAKARAKPLRFLSAVQSAITYELDGDPAFTNTLIKNAWNRESWSAHWRQVDPIELNAFAAFLDCVPSSSMSRNREHEVRSGYGRNVEIFDRTRFWAYDNWDGDHGAVIVMAHGFNSELDQPLPQQEVNCIARSICSWMDRKWNGGQGRRRTGVMSAHFSADMSLYERQVASGAFTARRRREASLSKITDAINAINDDGHKATQMAVSERASLSLKTVKRHWKNVNKAA